MDKDVDLLISQLNFLTRNKTLRIVRRRTEEAEKIDPVIFHGSFYNEVIAAIYLAVNIHGAHGYISYARHCGG